MLPFAYYLLKITICSAVLFGYYWFLLRNKVFHGYNRFYLLAIVGLSIVLPLCRINIFAEKQVAQTSVIKMLQVVTNGDEYIDEVIIGGAQQNNFSLVNFLPFVYVLVSIVLFMLFLQMLFSIFQLLKKYAHTKMENIHFINTAAAKGTPFSFFKFIFWNNQIDLHSPEGNRIFKHELAHIHERHSWDKIFINLVLIIFWCNPIFWLIRKELSMIHEFIADKRAVENGDTAAFAAMILATTYPQHNITIANNFFYSPIKRRLMMLTKNNNPKVNYISRLLVLPLLVIVFAAFTIKAKEYVDTSKSVNISKKTELKITSSTNAKNNNLETALSKKGLEITKDSIVSNTLMNYSEKPITVVIDAAHGGIDLGATANGMFEKDLALMLAKRIKSLNKNNNIKIILTREIDSFSTVQQKMDFASLHNPDLFISIHIDAVDKKYWNIKNGMKIFVPKNEFSHTEQSKIFASAIMASFKNNYGLLVPDTLSQRQRGIYVLQKLNIPSILIEAGYLTSKGDVDYLKSEKGQDAFANNILNGINSFLINNNITKINKEIADDEIYRQTVRENITRINQEDNKLGKIDASQIEANNNAVNQLTKALSDSNGIVVFLNERRIDKSAFKEIMNKGSVDISVYNIEEGFKKFGIKSKNGIIDIISKKTNQTNSVFYMDENTRGKIRVVDFLKFIEIKLFQDLDLVSCNVYFGGPGFPKVGVGYLNSNSLESIKELMQKCELGTSIAFTNIKVKSKKDGIRNIEEKIFALY
jgi:N-acetylmuramoyl-L-alanine amidase